MEETNAVLKADKGHAMTQKGASTQPVGEAFPMSDMQQAYWVGRQDALANDASAMHVYFEIDVPQFSLARFQNAWDRLLQRHDMLRVVALADGQQKILSELPPYAVVYHDLSSWTVADQDAFLASSRQEQAQRKADIAAWPQFSLCVFKLGEMSRLTLSLDIWCIDGRSINILFHELNLLYQRPDTILPALTYTFKDYIHWLKAQAKTTEYQAALAYWQARIPSFYGAPQLPTTSFAGKGKFTRLAQQFSPEETQRLLQVSASLGVTINGLLLGVFAEVIGSWATAKQFTLNIPRFNRPQIHPDINHVMGEFATFSLLSLDLTAHETWQARIVGIQRQLWEEMAYGQVSGVRILREMMKRSGTSHFGAMPIVFTPAPDSLSPHGASDLDWFGDMVFSLSQTPQVWLDSQYHFAKDQLHVNWDYVPAQFPEDMMAAMFAAYHGLLQRLGQEGGQALLSQAHPLTIAPAQLAARQQFNHVATPHDQRPLYQQFVERLAQPGQAQQTAVIAGDGLLSHQDLYAQSSRLGAYLSQQVAGAEPPIVAILLPKGQLQVVSVWGIVAARAAYLPLDTAQPLARLHAILQDARPSVVIVNDQTQDLVADLEGVQVLNLSEQAALLTQGALPCPQSLPGHHTGLTDLAYVIYTSGTTGQPKGVMIEWAGVLNAIAYSRASLFSASAPLVLLGVSALHHDMSVFDVLGVMVCGGTLVLPPEAERKNPEAWARLINQHAVTGWVSVPAMMEMLLTWSEYKAYRFDSLRTVLLGGDWLPLPLPDRIRALCAAEVTLYSVGGPTETTMWNIAHQIEGQEAGWASVPYGRPLSHCGYHILDESLLDVPDWVVGELYCSGVSLARGYLNDAARTAERFIVHPVSGERLYRSGDLGFYHPDGRIEFVGRQDGQLKVRGNRIEAGEVRAHLEGWPEVSRAVVYLSDGQQLVAALLLRPGVAKLSQDELYARAKGQLAEAMIPSLWQQLSELPLTGNGKVDMKALLALAQPTTTEVEDAPDRGLNETEVRLAALWAELLEQAPSKAQDNFFALGGDSLLLIRLLSRMQSEFKVGVSLPDLFTYLTLGEQASMVAQLSEHENEAVVPLIQPLGQAQYPLSHGQEDMWLAEQMSGGKVRFRITLGFVCPEGLDLEALHLSLQHLKDQHFALSSVFSLTAAGLTQRVDVAQNVPIYYEQPVHTAELAYAVTEVVRQPFDLLKTYGWRVHVLPLREGGHALVFNFHHVVFDAWSAPIFFKALQALYERKGQPPANPAKAGINYGDYVVWQRALVAAHEADSAAYWVAQHAGVEALLPVHADGPPQAKTLRVTLPDAIQAQVQKLCQEQALTYFIVLLSAFQATLAAQFKQSRFLIGTSSAGRENAQVHDMLGCFISNPIFRAEHDPRLSFHELVQQVNEQYKHMLQHQTLSFAQITDKVGKSGAGAGLNQLCQVCFVMQPMSDGTLYLGEHALTSFAIAGDDVRLVYELSCWQSADRLELNLKYDHARASDAAAAALLAQYEACLTQLLNQPSVALQDLWIATAS
ncbi:MAG: amino acid adenylation domain-containing protein [Neisseriaceae bacterium]|nr:amino acid adenylation domain-containing protein [Neisseriaceae bacterium]